MCGRCPQRRGRSLFPESTWPGLNYAVVSGKLLGKPRQGGGPGGDPVLVAEIEFPVAHPEHPRLLWAYASHEVELPGDLGGREFEALSKDTAVLVAGQLSERLALHDGRSSRSGAIVAACCGSSHPQDGSDSHKNSPRLRCQGGRGAVSGRGRPGGCRAPRVDPPEIGGSRLSSQRAHEADRVCWWERYWH